jgi:hypothetical protein
MRTIFTVSPKEYKAPQVGNVVSEPSNLQKYRYEDIRAIASLSLSLVHMDHDDLSTYLLYTQHVVWRSIPNF